MHRRVVGWQSSPVTETEGGLSAGEIQHRASRGALWTSLHVLVSLPLNVVATVVTARVLDVDGYGRLAFLTVVFAIAQQATDLGYTSATMQWGSRARVSGQDQVLGKYLSQATGFHVFVQGPLLAAVTLLVLHGEDPSLVLAFIAAEVLGLYVSGGALALVLDQRTDQVAKVAMATNVVTQAAVIVAAVQTEDAVPVLVARAFASCLTGLAALTLTRPTLRRAALRPRSPIGVPLGFMRFSIYSWGASCIALLVYSRSEILLLQGLSTAEQTAIYALAFGIAQQLTTPIDALIGPLVPATASLAAGHRDRFVRAVQRATSLASFLAGAVLAVAVPLLFVVFPVLYGEQYRGAAGLVVVLGAMSTLQTASMMTGVVVEAQRRGRELLVANGAALALGAGSSAILIPFAGAWGALVGNCIGQVTSITLLARAAGRGEPPVEWRAFVASGRPWFAALPAVALAVLVGTELAGSIGALGAAPISALIGAVVYIGVARWLRLGPPAADLEATVDALPVRLRRFLRWSTRLVATQAGR